jgi:hypothetical protein
VWWRLVEDVQRMPMFCEMIFGQRQQPLSCHVFSHYNGTAVSGEQIPGDGTSLFPVTLSGRARPNGTRMLVRLSRQSRPCALFSREEGAHPARKALVPRNVVLLHGTTPVLAHAYVRNQRVDRPECPRRRWTRELRPIHPAGSSSGGHPVTSVKFADFLDRSRSSSWVRWSSPRVRKGTSLFTPAKPSSLGYLQRYIPKYEIEKG